MTGSNRLEPQPLEQPGCTLWPYARLHIKADPLRASALRPLHVGPDQVHSGKAASPFGINKYASIVRHEIRPEVTGANAGEQATHDATRVLGHQHKVIVGRHHSGDTIGGKFRGECHTAEVALMVHRGDDIDEGGQVIRIFGGANNHFFRPDSGPRWLARSTRRSPI